MSGTQLRDYHLLLDEQASQIFAMTNQLAERCRKIGAVTLHSIVEIARQQRVLDNDAVYVTPPDMLVELMENNANLARGMREAHGTCEQYFDVATTSLLEDWIGETERRAWFLYECSKS